jgi:hypothetical protein
LHHQTVRRALEKDGWHITDDPLLIECKDLRIFADLGAEKIFAAEKAGQKIAVETKVFGGLSLVNDFEKALGQYNLYAR